MSASRARLPLGKVLAVAILLGAAPAGTEPLRGAASEQKAEEHFDRGLTHYNAGDFDSAITEFKQAYALHPAPGLLFNLAQAHRLKRDYEQALDFYHAYLKLEPQASNRADVEARISEMERQLERRPERPSGRGSRPANLPRLPPAAHGPALADGKSAHPGRPERMAGLIVGGSGVLTLSLGIYFGVHAASLSDELGQLSADKGVWNARYQDIYDSGQNYALAANLLYVAGGAAIASGALLYLLGWRKDVAARAVAISPVVRGATVGLSCRF